MIAQLLRGVGQACEGVSVGFIAERTSALRTSGAVHRACYYQGRSLVFKENSILCTRDNVY